MLQNVKKSVLSGPSGGVGGPCRVLFLFSGSGLPRPPPKPPPGPPTPPSGSPKHTAGPKFRNRNPPTVC